MFWSQRALKKILLYLIKFYQKNISRYRQPCCRFTPTCSVYAVTAIEKYGALKGGYLAFRRVLRCHPFHIKEQDLYDPVP
ncbi:MAG: membrane protein insertion efficiency factor YidD [Ruminococcaceae bacterium]|nr:membrane protein insertion efficiency factor YidD [Oscillospiraceae bacterium]